MVNIGSMVIRATDLQRQIAFRRQGRYEVLADPEGNRCCIVDIAR